MINACNVVYRSPHMSNMIATSLSNSYFISHFLFSTNTFPQKARQISGYEKLVWMTRSSKKKAPILNLFGKSDVLVLQSVICYVEITIIILLSSSNRKYPPFPSLSYFSGVVCLRWLSYHILSSIPYISRGHWDLVSVTGVQSMVFSNDRIHWSCSFVCRLQHLISSVCRLIWRHCTTKMLRYMLPSVCLRLRKFSQLSFVQYIGLCVFTLVYFPRFFIIIKRAIWLVSYLYD